MSTERIEPDYDAVPFPSDSSRSRPSLQDMYQSFQRNPASLSYPVFRTPNYEDPTGSSRGARRAASPHTLVIPGPVAASHYPGPQQHTTRLNTIGSLGSNGLGPQGRYIPWDDDHQEDPDEGPGKLARPKDPIQEQEERLTAAEAEYERLEAMDAREREKYLKEKRIEFHVTCRYHPTNASVLALICEFYSNLQSSQLSPSPRASSSDVWRTFPPYRVPVAGLCTDTGRQGGVRAHSEPHHLLVLRPGIRRTKHPTRSGKWQP